MRGRRGGGREPTSRARPAYRTPSGAMPDYQWTGGARRRSAHSIARARPARAMRSSELSPVRRCDRGARTELSIHVEDHGGIVLHEPKLRDDLARDFLFLDLLGEEPLELGHLRERFLAEAQL